MTNLNNDEILYWAWLTIAFGPANERKWAVSARFDSVTDFYDAVHNGFSEGMTADEVKHLRSASLKQAQGLLNKCAEHGINVCGYSDENYPKSLKEIYDPPSLLFSYGDIGFLNESATIGVVGARKITDYSHNVTDSLCRNLAQSGIVIVSGFAMGVDSAAHNAAIEAGGKTVAVLGSGLEYDYPRGSAELKKLISEHGAVISEYYPTSAGNHLSFKARNRILSGLSKGVLVVQASKTSGSLNTASYAVQQGKDLYVVPPHDIFSPEYAGAAQLIRDGAISVFSHCDILYEYYSDYPHKISFTKDPDAFVDRSGTSMFFAADIPIENKSEPAKRAHSNDGAKKDTVAENKAEKAKQIDMSALNEIQKKIIGELEKAPTAADELADKLDIDVSELFTELTALEIEGHVNSLAGSRYELA